MEHFNKNMMVGPDSDKIQGVPKDLRKITQASMQSKLRQPTNRTWLLSIVIRSVSQPSIKLHR